MLKARLVAQTAAAAELEAAAAEATAAATDGAALGSALAAALAELAGRDQRVGLLVEQARRVCACHRIRCMRGVSTIGACPRYAAAPKPKAMVQVCCLTCSTYLQAVQGHRPSFPLHSAAHAALSAEATHGGLTSNAGASLRRSH